MSHTFLIISIILFKTYILYNVSEIMILHAVFRLQKWTFIQNLIKKSKLVVVYCCLWCSLPIEGRNQFTFSSVIHNVNNISSFIDKDTKRKIWICHIKVLIQWRKRLTFSTIRTFHKSSIVILIFLNVRGDHNRSTSHGSTLPGKHSDFEYLHYVHYIQ